MGYIGLLLNAPYKIDSMVWMWMWISFYMYRALFLPFLFWLYEPEEQNGDEDTKM
jgi:hypothetical protein